LPRPRRSPRIIDGDPLDAIEDETVKAIDRRLREQFGDAGIFPSDQDARPKLVLIHDSSQAEAEDDPLAMIGRELDAAAHRLVAREKAKRRAVARARHYAAAAAALVVGLAGVSGASALITGTTGVPGLDDLLSVRDRQVRRSSDHPPRSDGRGYYPPWDYKRFRPVTVSRPINLPPGGGVRQAVAFENSNGAVCFALTAKRITPANPLPAGAFSCSELDQTMQLLAEAKADIVYSNGRVVVGLARAEVRHIKARGPDGKLAVRLAKPWTLDAPDTKPITVFVGFPPGYPHGSTTRPGALTGDLRRYVVRAH